MSAVVEWSVPFTLTSPAGTLGLSGSTDYAFMPDECDASAELRVTKRARPQDDGEIFARRFKSGYVMSLAMELHAGGAIATGSALVSMWDALLTQLDALVNPSLANLLGGNCRMVWTPTSHANRMLDRVRVLELPKPRGVLPKIARFSIDTEMSYAMDATQTTTSVLVATPLGIVSTGSTPMKPVIRVFAGSASALTSFTLTNSADLDENGNAKAIVFDSTLPGGSSIGIGHYVEIDCERLSAILDGNVAERMSSIDLQQSQFWRVMPAGSTNTITLTAAAGAGRKADVLWQAAWS